MTSGTLFLNAILSAVSEIDYIPYDDVRTVGTWSRGLVDGNEGVSTDSASDFAFYEIDSGDCPFWWILSSSQYSKMVDIQSGDSRSSLLATAGANHARPYGGMAGRNHVIICKENTAAPDSGNGHSLHILGAMIVKDRK